MAHPLPLEQNDGRPQGGVFGIGAATESPFAISHGHDADHDPSPVGFHESQLAHKLTVEARTGAPRLELELGRYPDDERSVGQPFVVLSIRGESLDLGGSCNVSRDGRRAGVMFSLPHRETLGALADAMRYLSDRGEAVGLLAGLPEDEHGAMYAANRPAKQATSQLANDSAVSALAAVRAILDRHAPLETRFPNWVQMVVGGCACAGCEQRRDTPFRCDMCGYHGAPFVPRCRCSDAWNEDMQEQQEKLAELRRLGVDAFERDSVTVSVSEVRRSIDDLERRKPTAECTGNEDKYDDCNHGCVECPVCGGPGEPFSEDVIDPWAVIRELRAAVDALAPDVTSIDAASPARGVYECRDRVGGKDTFYAINEAGDVVDIRVVHDNEDRDTVIAELVRLVHPELEAEAVESSDEEEPSGQAAEARTHTPVAGLATFAALTDGSTFDLTAAGRAVIAGGGLENTTAFTHNGETFLLLLTVPQLGGVGADESDRRARDRRLSWVLELQAAGNRGREANLAEINRQFLRAMAEIREGRGAWEWYSFKSGGHTYHGKFRNGDAHRSFAKLQEQYLEELTDHGIIRYAVVDPSATGLYIGDEYHVVDRPGVHAEHGASTLGQLDLSLALGRDARTSTETGITYPVDVQVSVAGDVTLQAIVSDFMHGLWERYGVKEPTPAEPSA